MSAASTDPKRSNGEHEPIASGVELAASDVRDIVEAGRYQLALARARREWLRPKFAAVSEEAVNRLKARFARGEQLGALERVDLATLHLAYFALIEQSLIRLYTRMEFGRADGADMKNAMILAAGLSRPLYKLQALLSNDRRFADLVNGYEDLLEPLVRNRNTARANRAQANSDRAQAADRKALMSAAAWCSDPLRREKLAQIPRRERIEAYLKQGRPSRHKRDRLQRMLREGLPPES